MPRKRTTEEWKEKAKEKHKSRYDYSLIKEYTGWRQKVQIICPDHGIFEQIANDHVIGCGCPDCGRKSASQKTAAKIRKSNGNEIYSIIKKLKSIHGKFQYEESEISSGNLNLECSRHGKFNASLYLHLKGRGCPKCELEEKKNEMITRLRRIEPIFEYDLSNYDFKKGSTIQISCPNHGVYCADPKKMIKRDRTLCRKCSNADKAIDFQEYLKRAIKRHGRTFSYLESSYSKITGTVQIFCKNHQLWFDQKANQHLLNTTKETCPECKKEQHIKRSTRIVKDTEITQFLVNNFENISLVSTGEFSIFDEIKLECLNHGIFKKKIIRVFANKICCPGCTKTGKSKIESEWLDSFEIPSKYRQWKIKIGKKNYFVDGFDPKTNTVYEFNGDYWHGNPKKYDSEEINPVTKCSFGVLYQKTKEKESNLHEAGFNVVSIWESDYRNFGNNT